MWIASAAPSPKTESAVPFTVTVTAPRAAGAKVAAAASTAPTVSSRRARRLFVEVLLPAVVPPVVAACPVAPVAGSLGPAANAPLTRRLQLARVEAEAGERLDDLDLLVGEVREERVGEEVDRLLDRRVVERLLDVADQRAVDLLDG